MVAFATREDGTDFRFEPFSSSLIKNSEDPRCHDPTPGDYLSKPASNAFLDLDGDCMPDIFLQKTRFTGEESYYTYFEVYTQKLYEGKQKWCLIQTNATLNNQEWPAVIRVLPGAPPPTVPLVEFSDLDRNGMVDLVFYDKGQMYVYYNMHEPIDFINAFENQILCRDWSTCGYGPVFQDFATYDFATGSPNVTIQNLQE